MKSLRETVISREPVYTKSVIKAGLRTEKGLCSVWVVVEDTDDIRVYEKFFRDDHVRILPSANESGHKGCEYVESIVTEIIAEEDFRRIFGIRDADYTKYETEKHVFPEAIFVTDRRDIEMMMLSAPSVRAGLEKWNVNIPVVWKKAEPILRKMGYLRICNHIRSLGCNFKRKVKVSRLWDETSHSIIPEWENFLVKLFLENCHEPFSADEFNGIVKELDLDKESSYDVCQGHDTIRLLQYMLVNTQADGFNEARIMTAMIRSYALEDFRTTELYKMISRWSAEHNVSIMHS